MPGVIEAPEAREEVPVQPSREALPQEVVARPGIATRIIAMQLNAVSQNGYRAQRPQQVTPASYKREQAVDISARDYTSKPWPVNERQGYGQ